MADIKNYFSHDSNARNDDKIVRLRMRHKAAGYGVYFMLLERMREDPGYMSTRDYNVISFDLREDASLIKSVVEEFGLFEFTDDGKYFYSTSFKRRMNIKDEKTKRRSEAGKKGMGKRWSEKKTSQVDPEMPQVLTEDLPTELEDCFQQLSHNQSWIEAVTMNTRSAGFCNFDIKSFQQYLKVFFQKLQNEGNTTKSPKDAMSHFARWLKLELEHEKDKRTNTTTKQEANGYAIQRFADRVATSQEGVYDEVPKPF